MPRAVRILSAGAHAMRAFGAAGAAEVVAVFSRSVHVRMPGGLVCIGRPSIGSGPLTALVEEGDAIGWPLGFLEPGVTGTAATGAIILGDVVIDVSRTTLWTPPPWPAMPSGAALRGTLSRFAAGAETAGRVPAEGFARLAIGEPVLTGLHGAALRKALLASATLGDWLAEALQPAGDSESDGALDAAAGDAVRSLIGLGGGLTPSGDDVLSGLLVALHATGAAPIADRIAGMIRAAPAGATSEIGEACLAAAMEGLPSAALAEAIAVLMTGDDTRFAAVLDQTDDVGHTSGWDMLAGALLALAAMAAK